MIGGTTATQGGDDSDYRAEFEGMTVLPCLGTVVANYAFDERLSRVRGRNVSKEEARQVIRRFFEEQLAVIEEDAVDAVTEFAAEALPEEYAPFGEEDGRFLQRQNVYFRYRHLCLESAMEAVVECLRHRECAVHSLGVD